MHVDTLTHINMDTNVHTHIHKHAHTHTVLIFHLAPVLIPPAEAALRLTKRYRQIARIKQRQRRSEKTGSDSIVKT